MVEQASRVSGSEGTTPGATAAPGANQSTGGFGQNKYNSNVYGVDSMMAMYGRNATLGGQSREKLEDILAMLKSNINDIEMQPVNGGVLLLSPSLAGIYILCFDSGQIAFSNAGAQFAAPHSTHFRTLYTVAEELVKKKGNAKTVLVGQLMINEITLRDRTSQIADTIAHAFLSRSDHMLNYRITELFSSGPGSNSLMRLYINPSLDMVKPAIAANWAGITLPRTDLALAVMRPDPNYIRSNDQSMFGNQFDESAIPQKGLGLVGGYVEFAKVSQANPMTGQVMTRFQPILRITSVIPMVPHPGIELILIQQFVEYYLTKRNWAQQFMNYNDAPVPNTENIGNLILHPDQAANPGKRHYVTNFNGLNEFITVYCAPMVAAIDTAVGLPNSTVSDFFGHTGMQTAGQFAGYQDGSIEMGKVLGNIFGTTIHMPAKITEHQIHQNIGAVRDSAGNSIDTRVFSFLNILSKQPAVPMDVEDTMLSSALNYQLGPTTAPYVLNVLRKSIVGESVVPLYEGTINVINAAFLDALVTAFRSVNLNLKAPDTVQSMTSVPFTAWADVGQRFANLGSVAHTNQTYFWSNMGAAQQIFGGMR